MKKFIELVEIVKKLRSSDGCAWDRALTIKSIKPFLLDETYELCDAIICDNDVELEEELGDLLFQIIMIAQISNENNKFDIEDVISKINKKMIRRHPHVFGNIKTNNINTILDNWENIKKNEKKHRKSYLDGIPKTLPSIIKAYKIQEKAARVGFDWENVDGVIEKINEEMQELNKELSNIRKINEKDENQSNNIKKRIKEEIGDMIFTIINLSRKLSIDPDDALLETIIKFKDRFSYIEDKLSENGKDFKETSLEIMDKLWEESKTIKN